jgi:hypothetical protein
MAFPAAPFRLLLAHAGLKRPVYVIERQFGRTLFRGLEQYQQDAERDQQENDIEEDYFLFSLIVHNRGKATPLGCGLGGF